MIHTSGDPGVASPAIVLEPKLRAPSLRSEQLVRPRVLELLEEAPERKITLISAPVGYGKTTLVTQWRQAQEADVPFAWVSLDEQDNDPVRLWRHIVEALRRVVPTEGFGADVLARMSAAGQRLVTINLPVLINELADSPHRVILVLDDYQLVTENDCHELLVFFVDHLPENVHLVISTRSDPPLPLGRLRARGEMNEIRVEQLAFSEEDAACLLNEKMWLGLEPGDILLLLDRTEGWPAGLYLAALSLQKREERHAFIESFGGSSRYIVDLLGEEVLAGLDEQTREFLLRTSVLRRMTGPLCDAVADTEGSGMLLRELARSNLFVVPLDGQGEWYRYHHLFSDLLLYELRSSRPELAPVLHGRARVWLEGAGFLDPAIRHAIAGGDYECAVALITRHWFGYMSAGQTANIEQWLEALPQDLITRDAALALVKAWTSALYGRREETERFLALAESNPGEGPLPDGATPVAVGAALVRVLFGYGGVQSSVEVARRAAALEPSPRTVLVRYALGLGLYYSGEVSRSRKPLEEALALIKADQPVLRIAVLFALSSVAVDEGRLDEAESLAREACALVDGFRLRGIPQATLAPIALGRALAELGKVDEARSELEGGLSERRMFPGLNPWPGFLGLLALARVRSARGDRAGAREVLAEARSTLDDFPDAAMFHERLERQERKLRTRNPREGAFSEELTGRELDVVGLLDGELSTRQMGQRLYLAPSTVRTHIKSIYRKLGASSRREAVEVARTRGLI